MNIVLIPVVSAGEPAGLSPRARLPTTITVDEAAERPPLSVDGDEPIGLALGGVVAAALVLLPALVVGVFYLVANVSALVIGPDFDSDPSEPAVLLVGLVGTVTFLLLGIVAAVALLGRALSPKNRDV
jgi:hypothetical protein